MLKKVAFIVLLFSLSVNSQSYIKGSLNSTKKYSWIVLYQLKSTKQHYIADTSIVDGRFTIEFPKNASKGMYRLTYDLENNGYVDFIYNNEIITLEFDPENALNTLVFSTSEENKLYREYLGAINPIQNMLDSLQIGYFTIKDADQRKSTNELYLNFTKNKRDIQDQFEKKSIGKLANHFIKSNNRYSAPNLVNTPQEYLNSEKKHFFDFLNFKDSVLMNATFLSEKVVNYVFHMNDSDDEAIQNMLYKKAVNEVMEIISDDFVKSEILTSLLYAFAQIENNTLTHYLIDDFYNKLPPSYISSELIADIKSRIKLAVGNNAPEITWTENGTEKKLSEINNADNYVLVFWSTTCSHCLDEIPKFYDYINNKSEVHVIAIALEENRNGFDKYTSTYTKWTNILGLKKWENSIAKTYDINATPTYFILDKNKKIIAKPEYFEDVKGFLEKPNTP